MNLEEPSDFTSMISSLTSSGTGTSLVTATTTPVAPFEPQAVRVIIAASVSILKAVRIMPFTLGTPRSPCQ